MRGTKSVLLCLSSFAVMMSGLLTVVFISLPTQSFAQGCQAGATCTVTIKTTNGHFLTAVNGGGVGGPNTGSNSSAVHTDAKSIGSWETLTCAFSGPNVTFQTQDGHFITAVNGGGMGGANANPFQIHTDAAAAGAWGTFTLVPVGGSRCALKTLNGYYLTAVNGGGWGNTDTANKFPIHTNATKAGVWETFTLTTSGDQGPVWGFADLHSHPASHLGFGSDSNGNNGLFWGKPADDANLASLDLANDLAACDHFDHNPGAIDPIQIASDVAMMSALQGSVAVPFNDTGQGNPTFASWPSAVSIEHQQMDITSIRRAFDGGLRLLFASVTDDELITILWNQKFNGDGQGPPIHDPEFDFHSAINQLTYIQALVAANASWMQIVASPSDARAAINGNPPKLAVVLSLEMDTLTLKDILLLVQNFQVRHVIPVHLVDNPAFGGTAIYNDMFNSENPFYNNGQFYHPVPAPSCVCPASPPSKTIPYCPGTSPLPPDCAVTFNLSSSPSILTPMLPSSITSILNLNGLGDAVTSLIPGLTFLCSQNIAFLALGLPPQPCPLATGEFGYLPWPISPPAANPGPPGQINSLSLNKPNFLSLMTARCGTAPCALLLDVAHMGQQTALDALNLAAQYQFPLMDSHTGLRCDGVACSSPYGWVGGGITPQGKIAPGTNERGLPTSQLQMIRNLGGVIGLGEVAGGEAANSGPLDPDPVGSWINSYSIAWSLMGNRGVALGTDMNGLSPLIPGDSVATGYPITVAQDFGGPLGTMQLPQFQLGPTRQFDFQKDGIATLGLLPDFIQAASLRAAGVDPNASAPSAAIWAIFHSAEDTIEMWEKVLAVQPDIPIGGSNQIASSCSIGAMGPWTAGRSIPVLDQPIQIYTELLDQNGLPMTFPLSVVYSGNIPGIPSSNLVTGLDHLTVNLGLPNNYHLTASVTSVSSFKCSATITLPPILTAISSPLSLDAGVSTFTPLANVDGSTQLTLTGTGFANAALVTFGNTTVAVTPTGDSKLVVNAPRYNASAAPAVSVYVTSSTGLRSNMGTVQYFAVNVPAVTAYSSETCGGIEKFVVDVFALNASGALVENSTTPVKFNVGGLTASDGIDSNGQADFIGNFASLRPANRSSYSGTATYAGNQAHFLLKRPQRPSPAACSGWASGATLTGSGAIFPRLPTCFACKLTDLPDYFSDSRFYIDDLIALGVVLPSGLRFLPDAAVSERTFLSALSKVVNPVRARLVSDGSSSVNSASTRPVTRGEAANFVTRLIAIQSADSVQARTEALTRAGYLRAVNGGAAPEGQLTRLDMVDLLWHVARVQISGLAKKTTGG